LPFFINYGGDGPASAKFVCGYLACDAGPFNPLLDNLPPVIKANDPQDTGVRWLRQFIRFAMMESADKRAGGESVLAKLSELMFIEVVRRHLEALPPEQAGWLAGLRDPFVGKALSLAELDDRGPGEAGWTVALSPRRALHRPRRHSADAVSRQMANADRLGALK
jgi:Cupin